MDDEDIACSRSSTKDTQFDLVIGHIEDIVIDHAFQTKQMDFFDKHYTEFEDTEENKLSYTHIFQDYVNMLEKYIEHELVKRMPSFSMKNFMNLLNERKNEVSEELLELLLSFTDFLTFKELMIDHKNHKLGNVVDLSLGLSVTSLKNDEFPQVHENKVSTLHGSN